MYLIKLTIKNYITTTTYRTYDKVYVIKDEETMIIIQDNNYNMFIDEDKELVSVEIKSEEQIFAGSNCGIFQIA